MQDASSLHCWYSLGIACTGDGCITSNAMSDPANKEHTFVVMFSVYWLLTTESLRTVVLDRDI